MNKNEISLQNRESFEQRYKTIFEQELDALKGIIDIVKTSHYNQAFLEEKIEVGDDGKKKSVLVPNLDAMLSTALTGRMIGLDPLSALAMGKSLDQHAISKVQQGKRLGLDVYQSLRLIHIFTNPSDGKVSQTVSANLIEGILLRNNIKISVLKDCQPIYQYVQLTNNEQIDEKEIIVDGKLKDEYVLFIKGIHNQSFITEQISKGKTFLTRFIVNYETVVRMERTYPDRVDVKTYTVTRQDAINWGFIKGVTSFGTTIEKSRKIWEARYNQMALKTAISNCGRRIANDLVEGLYSYEELGLDYSEDEDKIHTSTTIDTVAEDVTDFTNNNSNI